MLLMKSQSIYMIKPEGMLCNKPDEITRFSHAVVQIFCPVVFKKVMLQLQIVSHLLLQ